MTTRRAVLAGAAAWLAPGARAAEAPPVVACPAGRFTGTRTGKVATFRGMRYGHAARFAAPVAEPPATLPVFAQRPGPACPQRGKRRPQDENCLTLNVWTAAGANAGLPVIVWIHGGAYAFGSANDDVTDGTQLAARDDVVVVSVNHRLNAFGYLYLGGVDPDCGASANAGQLDLVLALRWVRANIAAFGGDPARVTLIGQSGGGGKIATLLAMPSARGLFQRAVTMSGQQVTVSNTERATERARAFMTACGVTDVAALRGLPAERLVAALDAPDPFERSPLYTGPVLDGVIIDRHPFSPDAAPGARSVTMMLGGTRDETRDFFDPVSTEMRELSWETLPDPLAAELPVPIPPSLVIETYRRHLPHASPAEVFYAATTDGRSWRPQIEEAEALARAGTPAYVYQLDFASPTRPGRGAFHGLDIALLFGTFDATDAGTGTGSAARALSREMQDRIIAFAAHGSPGWPPYRPTQRATMIFDAHTQVVRDPRRWQRLLFAPYPYTQPGS
ncbi:para-nitrobenzyl esterase [Sphingomonas jinjuensis]|uniref:Carboxylic ester hydrolase n=1 Tax=Sphingomonas jinjuensis TaxID=535907 RepID=A0A840FH84_9SPHN|nr:para-nitrobenzyl esterase [Sphingomonas jinjuensis]